MAFQRFFDTNVIQTLSGESMDLYQKLTVDIKKGDVFPAVRQGNLDFYFAGGLLFSLSNSGFAPRDKNYEKNHNQGTAFMDYYKKCQTQNKNKFIGTSGKPKERQVLDRLNKKTFIPNHGKVVVIDVEINIHEDNNKKCDLLLLNTDSKQIMFVEGKLYQNKEMREIPNKDGNGKLTKSPPPVALQVCGYTQTLITHQDKIVEQYAKHIEIVNTLFNKNFPTKVSLVLPAKLLVYSQGYERPSRENSTRIITEYICKRNVMWNFSNNYNEDQPSLETIWDYLYY